MQRDTADLNLVLAVIKHEDPLQERARQHLEDRDRLLVPFSVGMELLFVAHRFGFGHVEALGAAGFHFDLELPDVLYNAAEALDTEEVSTVFDAVHLADAHDRGRSLHTADEELISSAYPTTPF